MASNILTGDTASYDEGGYVFDPHESYEVTGWRKSTTQIAAFTFAPLPESYAARTGRPADVGVIGMAVFNERLVPPQTYAAPGKVRATGRRRSRRGQHRARQESSRRR